MDRCPNCGAPVRPGARFCTTCGNRLTPETPASAPTPAADERPAAWATAWPSQQATAEGAPATSEQATAPGANGEATEQAAPSSAATWPSPASSWASGWGASANNQPAGAAESDSTGAVSETAEEEVIAVGPAEPAESASRAEEGDPLAGTEEKQAVQEAAPEAGEAGDATVAATPPAEEPGAPPPAAEEAASPPAAAAEATPTSMPQPDHAETLTRANDLLDQLRDLLPSLAPGAPSVDVQAIADDLAAARNGTDQETAASFDELREVLTNARQGSVDFDTVVNLINRRDAIFALQDGYDRLAAAIDQAVTALRGEQD